VVEDTNTDANMADVMENVMDANMADVTAKSMEDAMVADMEDVMEEEAINADTEENIVREDTDVVMDAVDTEEGLGFLSDVPTSTSALINLLYAP
jgi:hypothetical protein